MVSLNRCTSSQSSVSRMAIFYFASFGGLRDAAALYNSTTGPQQGLQLPKHTVCVSQLPNFIAYYESCLWSGVPKEDRTWLKYCFSFRLHCSGAKDPELRPEESQAISTA